MIFFDQFDGCPNSVRHYSGNMTVVLLRARIFGLPYPRCAYAYLDYPVAKSDWSDQIINQPRRAQTSGNQGN